MVYLRIFISSSTYFQMTDRLHPILRCPTPSSFRGSPLAPLQPIPSISSNKDRPKRSDKLQKNKTDRQDRKATKAAAKRNGKYLQSFI